MATLPAQPIETYTVPFSGRRCGVQATNRLLMLKRACLPKCGAPRLGLSRKNRRVALLTIELGRLIISQIHRILWSMLEDCGCFPEIKLGRGSVQTPSRNPDAVIIHLRFCMPYGWQLKSTGSTVRIFSRLCNGSALTRAVKTAPPKGIGTEFATCFIPLW